MHPLWSRLQITKSWFPIVKVNGNTLKVILAKLKVTHNEGRRLYFNNHLDPLLAEDAKSHTVRMNPVHVITGFTTARRRKQMEHNGITDEIQYEQTGSPRDSLDNYRYVLVSLARKKTITESAHWQLALRCCSI